MPSKSEMVEFERQIEKLVQFHKIDHIDAIVMYCKENELEIEVAASLVNKNLKHKLSLDAQSLNLIPKTKKLPL